MQIRIKVSLIIITWFVVVFLFFEEITNTFFLLVDKKNSNQNNPLEAYIHSSLVEGALGERFWCGRWNKANGYNCGTSMDQAAMINLYAELFAKTGNGDFWLEAYKFLYTGNGRCWWRTWNFNCDEWKQQGEMIIAILKLYLATRDPELKEILNNFLDFPIENLNIRDDWDIARMSQAILAGAYFLDRPELKERYFLLKLKMSQKSTFFTALLLLERLYWNTSNEAPEIDLQNLTFNDANFWAFAFCDILELLSFLWEEQEKERVILNNIKVWENFPNNYMQIWRRFLSIGDAMGIRGSFLNRLSTNTSLFSNLKDESVSKGFSYADEGDNFAPFFMMLYDSISPNNNYHWNLDKNYYEQITKLPRLDGGLDYSKLSFRTVYVYIRITRRDGAWVDGELHIKNLEQKAKVLKFIPLDARYSWLFPKGIHLVPAQEIKMPFSFLKEVPSNEEIKLKFYFEDGEWKKYYTDNL